MAEDTFVLEFEGGNTMTLRKIKPADPDMQGTDVKSWQRLLDDRGFPVGALDGYWGDQSVAACKAFQTSQGIDPNGVINAKTAERLIEGKKDQD